MNDQIMRIFQLAMQLNRKPTKQDLTGEKPTVFINFNGHVSLLEVRIYQRGWYAWGFADREYNMYLEEGDFDECIFCLEELCQQWCRNEDSECA